MSNNPLLGTIPLRSNRSMINRKMKIVEIHNFSVTLKLFHVFMKIINFVTESLVKVTNQVKSKT